MAATITFSRQRVPMLDASMLEDRTRPAPADAGTDATRARFGRWLARPVEVETPSAQASRPAQARLGLR